MGNNITYDACERPPRAPRRLRSLVAPHAAGDLLYFDPSTGKTITYNLGDIAWVLASTALVWLMIPGVGFFYSGLLRRKNALSMIYLSVATIAVVSFQVRLCRCALSSGLFMFSVVFLGVRRCMPPRRLYANGAIDFPLLSVTPQTASLAICVRVSQHARRVPS